MPSQIQRKDKSGEKRSIEHERTASFQQQAAYRFWEQSPSDPRQNLSIYCKLPCDVRPDLAIQALCSLVFQHSELRSSYRRDGRVLCKKARGKARDVILVDAKSWTAQQIAVEAEKARRAPFDLASGRVFRALVYCVADTECYLLLCVHAVAADAESLAILGAEFSRIYTSLQKNKLESHIDSSFTAKPGIPDSIPFWRDYLKGESLEFTLPNDYPRKSQTGTFSRGKRDLFVTEDLQRRIERLSRVTKIPLRSIYLAGYSVLLSRYAGTSEIRIALSATTRSGASCESSIGNFTNPIPVTADCNPEYSIRQLLEAINDAANRALDHRHISLPEILAQFALGNESSSTGRFSGYYSWLCAPEPLLEADFAGLEILDWEYSAPLLPDFELGLVAEERKGLLRFSLVFQEDLFQAATIERIAGHWNRLMTDLGALDLASTVGHLEMMPDEERDLVLTRYVGAISHYPSACLHDLFTEQVRLRPDSEALVFGNEHFTYRRLDERSNQIARFLYGAGIAHGDRVGIFMDRCADMIVSMLGVLKTGAAYVPIDPEYPAERLKFIAEDTAIDHVLSVRRVRAKLPVSAPTSYLDDPDSSIWSNGTDPVTHHATPESIAVIIYTSGSTGLPKAVCIPHRAAVRTVRSQNYVDVYPGERITQVGSPSFDAAIMETWLPLVNGGTLVGVNRATLLDPCELIKFLRSERISIMVLSTAYLHQIGRDAPHVLASVRKVLFGGEAAEPGPMREILKHVAPGVLVNGYGPAEGCVISTYFDIESISETSNAVPIGRPVSNAQVYLLDQFRRPVPIGVQGEIYIGGEGVAKGYWNRPELTAERFLPDTFSGRADRLLYKTGDLACMRGDGLLEFRGRADEQVKIRGYRIELAEVRQAIEAHPDVKQAFLMVREDQPGDKRLTAYVTLNRFSENPQETLRQHTKQKLPAHMLPAAFVVMQEIPINTNGKVDRKALPAPIDRPELVSTYQGAHDDLEQKLVGIWQELLGLSHVGIDDNFFDLGGHSLLAARLVARVETETYHNIPVASLFEAPTISQLAAKLRRNDYTADWSPLVLLKAADKTNSSRSPFFCVHSLGANLVSFHKAASMMRGDRAIYGVQPQGLDGKEQPLDSIEAMAGSYIEEILKVQPRGPYYLGGVCLGGVLAYEIAQQLKTRGEQIAVVALIDSFLPGRLQYQHTRKNWIEYLDRHFGEMLRLPVWESAAYFLRWAANGAVLLRRALGWRENSSLAQATRRIAQVHIKAFNSYQPRRYTGKLIQFMCSDAPQRSYEDRRLAWSCLVPGGFELRIVPGDHLSMLEGANIAVLSGELQAALDRIDGVASDSVHSPQPEQRYSAKPIAAQSSGLLNRVGELSAALPVVR